jgi:hypothetical protein
VTGRVSALALDPSDPTGNRLYVGTTGGGVWRSQNAGTSSPANIVFAPLTDNLAALGSVADASISIGALSVQPGGTGVILAGTGDPNDALDSYYGAGILRSSDGGNTWSLISYTADQKWAFTGEGFAGFAWSTVSPQLVVAAVSQAYEGTLVNAGRPLLSYEGLYYSKDGGATWNLATITDGSGEDVQGPSDSFVSPDGNAATAVVWNPVRKLFVAAVRYHGYYQSADGITWTRLAAQPGSGLNAAMCPTHGGSTGSPACPIFRGALAVNPVTGDTFAWTVDINNQDQGLWQDVCQAGAGACSNQTLVFGQQWTTAALETDDPLEGPATIENGDYNLTLGAVPSGLDTMVLAGANDLWKADCPVSQGCAWRNTTNSTTCMSAAVGEYQHALTTNASNPLEIFLGNDSGLWRSTDGVGETGPVCASTDASHFQNLNGSLGSLAEVESISQVGGTPYTMMAGLGANGTAGVKSGEPTTDWPEILGGEGGPVAIDAVDSSNWYVNNQAGVAIYLCSQQSACTPAEFGTAPAIDDADVGGDGLTMTAPAPFLVDAADSTQLLIGTCRVWRGPASGVGWSSANAISPILDGNAGNAYCSGDALIRSMAAIKLASGGEAIYVGMHGATNGGANLPGHVLQATVELSGGTAPGWTDLTLNPVTNDAHTLNYLGLDISSITIDTHDPTGNTVYVTVAGIPILSEDVQTVYRSTDGGAHWTSVTSNLPAAPANSLVVDPEDANTVYVATDAGVYSTRQIASCGTTSSGCWSAFGSGLPEAPAIALSAALPTAAVHDLVAATYGRGIWATPLWTASESLTTAAATPAPLTFPSQATGTASSAQTVTLANTGTAPLLPASVTLSGDFSETDDCQGQTVASGASCALQVAFKPTATGSRTGSVTIGANVSSGELTLALSGTGTAAAALSLNPGSLSFGPVQVGAVSAALQVAAQNTGPTVVSISFAITGSFSIASNACASSLAAGKSCQLTVEFAPTQTGAATGTLTLTGGGGTQAVSLSGTGASAPSDSLSPTSLAFSSTFTGQQSAAQTVTVTNSGDLPLTSIAMTVSGPFQTSNNCTATLAGHSSCILGVVFAPTQAGSLTGTLTVVDALHTQTVSLAGTGVLSPTLSVSPSSLSFAGELVGQTSPVSTLMIGNTGGAALNNVGFQMIGPSAGNFSTGSTTCGATLNSLATCTVGVTFTPAATGGSTATLVVSSSTAGVTPATVPLTGTGQAMTGINVNPPQLVFPIVAPGQSSPAQTVTVTDTGGSAASSLTLTATSPFSLTQNTCGAGLGAGSSCSVGVVFSPNVNGAFSGTLTIASPALVSSASVPLSGTGGVPGSVQTLPILVAFPETGVGLASSPVTVTVTNPSGTASLTSFVLAVSAGFRLVNNGCPTTLASLASCTAGVELAPLSAGAQTGSLTVGSSTLAAGAFVPLSGMGFDFTVAASGPASETVANGQTADFKLVIVPLNGSQGAFSLQCGSLPPYSACTFDPASEGVAANSTGYEVVEISTGLAETTSSASAPIPWRRIPLACGLLLLPLALKRRRRALLVVALLAVLAGGVTSCTASSGGSGGISRTGSGITPAGTYSVPVTVQSNGVSHRTTLTLTVD